MILMFKIATRCSSELSSAPMNKKVVMCLTENMGVLDQLRAGRSYSAAGCEFIVNE